VIALVASACASATGSIDPLDAIADWCEQRDVWLHVDGAHGASAVMSSRYRELVRGIERADSVVWDAHKMLALPSLVTAVLFRDGARSFEAFSQEASYVFGTDSRSSWSDFGQRNMECTKRMMSVTFYATVSLVGTALLDDYVTRQFDLARRFATMIEDAPDFELAVQPECNIVCFRLTGCTDHDRLRDRVVKENGSFYLTRTTLSGRAHLRVTLMNPFTDEADLAALLETLRHEM
jgi:L-2,4-diaminobutyrate decarboxylase